MKTYRNLYEICISESNRIESIHSAKKSKRIRKIIKQKHLSDDDLLYESLKWIEQYENSKHSPILIRDGITRKERLIFVPTIEELVVQHCVVNAMYPLLSTGMYEHSYASLPNRGAHKGKKIIKKWINNDKVNTKYVLKMDVRHFFDSIPHDLLKARLLKYIKDEKMLHLLFKIIDVNDCGIPLGFYTSQWLSNWFLQGLDHYIKEQCGAKYYIRYMDDMVIFSSNKKTLHKTRVLIEEFLNKKLGLNLKSNWQVFRFSYIDKQGIARGRDLDFIGFRFHSDKIIMRKSIMYKATRKANKISKKERPTIYDARQMLAYLGYIKATNVYTMYVYWIKPYVSFRQLKNKISKHDLYDDKRIYHKIVKEYS